jgi:hypothetical protein
MQRDVSVSLRADKARLSVVRQAKSPITSCFGLVAQLVYSRRYLQPALFQVYAVQSFPSVCRAGNSQRFFHEVRLDPNFAHLVRNAIRFQHTILDGPLAQSGG